MDNIIQNQYDYNRFCYIIGYPENFNLSELEDEIKKIQCKSLIKVKRLDN